MMAAEFCQRKKGSDMAQGRRPPGVSPYQVYGRTLPKSLVKAVAKRAARRGETVSGLIRTIVEAYADGVAIPAEELPAKYRDTQQVVTFRVMVADWDRAQRRADKQGLRISDVIKSGLLRYLSTAPSRRTERTHADWVA